MTEINEVNVSDLMFDKPQSEITACEGSPGADILTLIRPVTGIMFGIFHGMVLYAAIPQFLPLSPTSTHGLLQDKVCVLFKSKI